ncbi:Ser-Thr-rich glycosyl-phosphatidyl-inositol-anchored membrane family-domain-containing protein, partial [Dichomitus squalens]
MSALLALAILSARALAALTPTAPGPGDTFAAGSPCTIKWDADTSGTWTNVSIYLMTGPNSNMTRLVTVTSGLDGTDTSLSPYNWTCPEVDPYSTIYFYQFTNRDDAQDSQWTTRFTITSESGDSVEPEHPTQPDGDSVPWGEGHVSSEDDDESPKHGHSKSTSSTNDTPQSGTDDQGDGTADMSTDDDSQDGQSKHVEDASTSPFAKPFSAVTSLGTKSLPSPNLPTRPPKSGSISKEVSFPTISLPRKARPPMQVSPSSVSPASGTSTRSQMGPGISNMDNSLQLASAGSTQRGQRWKATATLYWLLAAMLL